MAEQLVQSLKKHIPARTLTVQPVITVSQITSSHQPLSRWKPNSLVSPRCSKQTARSVRPSGRKSSQWADAVTREQLTRRLPALMFALFAIVCFVFRREINRIFRTIQFTLHAVHNVVQDQAGL
jgi:hypothetical protein